MKHLNQILNSSRQNLQIDVNLSSITQQLAILFSRVSTRNLRGSFENYSICTPLARS